MGPEFLPQEVQDRRFARPVVAIEDGDVMAIDPFEAIFEEQRPGIDVGVTAYVAVYPLIGGEMEGTGVDHDGISVGQMADLAR